LENLMPTTEKPARVANEPVPAAGMRSAVFERMNAHIRADPLHFRRSRKQLRPGTVKPDGKWR
jgi:hypothetical protein